LRILKPTRFANTASNVRQQGTPSQSTQETGQNEPHFGVRKRNIGLEAPKKSKIWTPWSRNKRETQKPSQESSSLNTPEHKPCTLPAETIQTQPLETTEQRPIALKPRILRGETITDHSTVTDPKILAQLPAILAQQKEQHESWKQGNEWKIQRNPFGELILKVKGPRIKFTPTDVRPLETRIHDAKEFYKNDPKDSVLVKQGTAFPPNPFTETFPEYKDPTR